MGLQPWNLMLNTLKKGNSQLKFNIKYFKKRNCKPKIQYQIDFGDKLSSLYSISNELLKKKLQTKNSI